MVVSCNILDSGMLEWNVSSSEVKTIKAHFKGKFTQGANKNR